MFSPLRVQTRVIWALILKEVRILHRGKALGYVWAIIEPMAQMLGWLVFLTVLRQNPPIGSSVITFIATGLLPITIFMKTHSAMMTALPMNRQFMNYPIVRPNDTIVAKFLLEAATAIVVMFIMFSILIVVGEAGPPHDLVRIIHAIFLIMAVSFGFGVFCAYLAQVATIYVRVIRFVSRILYLFSGIFFIPDLLPRNLWNIIWYNPLAHGVELFRSAYYPSFESRMPVPSYMIAWAVGLTLAGLMLSSIRRMRRRYS
jgi:capsular polysaccharide transport system permease protein